MTKFGLTPFDNTEPYYANPMCLTPELEHPGNTSDGFHTFDELYEHRMLLNAALFNAWARGGWGLVPVAKSYRHSDGELCFGGETEGASGGWFIVTAQLPTGQISYHYKNENYDLFYAVPHKYVAPEYDGHTPEDVVSRLREFLTPPPPLPDGN